MTDAVCACGHLAGMHDGMCTANIPVEDGEDWMCPCQGFRVLDAPADSLSQPAPAAEDASKPAVWALVIVDMCERDRVGRARYGTPLQPHNGRDALKDAYAEALDLAVYLRQAIYERDNK